jgi:cbb3-type cytochrome c oxidase subunit II
MVEELTSKHRPIAVALMVAGIYGYFLLFSQFAFLEMVTLRLAHPIAIKSVLACMAFGGVVGGFWVARTRFQRAMDWGMLGCAVTAWISTLAHNGLLMGVVSLMMGLSLGAVTTSLAARTGEWLKGKNRCLWVGVGTGLGYALCNVPQLFQASPQHQAYFAAIMMLVAYGAYCLIGQTNITQLAEEPSGKTPSVKILLGGVIIFLAMVWLDSAAFFVIQHAPDMKKATWGEEMLWRNALLHAVSAAAAGYFLDRGWFRAIIWLSLLVLCLAAWWVNTPTNRLAGGMLYPVAVSLYSTALVCWPRLLHGQAQAWKRASWVFAVAGWMGSGLGIGMAENLAHVPLWFLILAVLLVGGILSHYKITFIMMLVIASIAVTGKSKVDETTENDRGRRVYVAEGCINCHSKYLRADRIDETYWGQMKSEALKEKPVLIGNRRQGPDLSDVGKRRSAWWLREHFLEPRAFSPDSVMPSYKHLFADSRGEDLIAYLIQDAGLATLRDQPIAPKDAREGEKAFMKHCAVCHGEDARGEGTLSARMSRSPANLVAGPFVWSPGEGELLHHRIAGIIRYGIPGTDMPGHETWTDDQVANVVSYLLDLRKKR